MPGSLAPASSFMVGSVPRAPRTLPEILSAYERIILIKAIQSCGGSRSGAARSLGISRSRLYARVRALGVDMTQMPARQGRPRKDGCV